MSKSKAVNLKGLKPEYKELAQMKYKDIKAACIVRGMEFNEVVESDHGKLSSWYLKNYATMQNPELLEDFDVWVDEQISEKYDKTHPFRKFRQHSSLNDETGDVKISKKSANGAGVKIPKKKVKKEKHPTFGVFMGTTKEFTMSRVEKLYKAKKSISSKANQERLANKISEKYPDVSKKSIMIWIKKATKILLENV